MSSFIVEDETIIRIIQWIHPSNEKLGTALGRKMLRLNIDACNQRYPENHYLNEADEKARIKNFKFNIIEELSVSKVRALKSLHCFLYQCSEGNVPSRKLYKTLEKLSQEWADKIVSDLPEYEKAEWN